MGALVRTFPWAVWTCICSGERSMVTFRVRLHFKSCQYSVVALFNHFFSSILTLTTIPPNLSNRLLLHEQNVHRRSSPEGAAFATRVAAAAATLPELQPAAESSTGGYIRRQGFPSENGEGSAPGSSSGGSGDAAGPDMESEAGRSSASDSAAASASRAAISDKERKKVSARIML